MPLYKLLGLPQPPALPTCMTIVIAAPDEMAQLAVQYGSYAALKIKLGSDDDFARLDAVAAARPDARLRLDANAGWSAEDAVGLIRRLERFNVELIEQPVAKDDVAGMGYVQAHTRSPSSRTSHARRSRT